MISPGRQVPPRQTANRQRLDPNCPEGHFFGAQSPKKPSSRYRGPNANFVRVGANSRGDFEADGLQQCFQIVADALVEAIQSAASVIR